MVAMHSTVWRTALILFLFAAAAPASAQNSRSDSEISRDFSAADRQGDLARLKDFVYPKGFTDQAIVDLENGRVPADLAVVDYARLHCGETNRFVLNPCMVRYADAKGVGYYVVMQDGNMRFADLKGATDYYQRRMSDTANLLAIEIDLMNAFVDDFCGKIKARCRYYRRTGRRPSAHQPPRRPGQPFGQVAILQSVFMGPLQRLCRRHRGQSTRSAGSADLRQSAQAKPAAHRLLRGRPRDQQRPQVAGRQLGDVHQARGPSEISGSQISGREIT